jgi:predicted TIM-barrel fold metal-dependent hydrolase
MALEFFDCNACYGMDASADVYGAAHTLKALQQEMARAGVGKAIVHRVEQWSGSPLVGNDLLADDLRGAGGELLPNFYGTWGIVPTHTHELPEPSEMAGLMKQNRIIGWRLYPGRSRFLLKGFALREWLELALARKIPVFISTAHGAELSQVADLMEEFPRLIAVLTYANEWPSDRLLRPFVATFPNLYLDTTFLMTDGGLESFVQEYGSSRLVYGSGFPRAYFGAGMLMVRHAQIPEEDRAAIASGNLERIVREVAL